MFSGIIEKLGTIRSINTQGETIYLSVQIENSNYSIGDSICVNGVCLTVESIQGFIYSFCISPETNKLTTFSNLNKDDIVNIESSLTLDKYISGHLVQGHVDTQAKIIQIDQMDTSWRLTLRLSDSLSKYIITKGSIAIDGISLTINEIQGNEFSVMIIPHTYENTVIKTYKEGDNVNIEFDLLAKYIEKLGKAND